MTPYRRCRHPYPAYFAENTLYLSPELEAAFPDCRRRLAEEAGREGPAVPDMMLRQALLDTGVLRQTEGGLRWIARVHGAQALEAVLPQPDGDWYMGIYLKCVPLDESVFQLLDRKRSEGTAAVSFLLFLAMLRPPFSVRNLSAALPAPEAATPFCIHPHG